jgi:hypothetical protein
MKKENPEIAELESKFANCLVDSVESSCSITFLLNKKGFLEVFDKIRDALPFVIVVKEESAKEVYFHIAYEGAVYSMKLKKETD